MKRLLVMVPFPGKYGRGDGLQTIDAARLRRQARRLETESRPSPDPVRCQSQRFPQQARQAGFSGVRRRFSSRMARVRLQLLGPAACIAAATLGRPADPFGIPLLLLPGFNAVLR